MRSFGDYARVAVARKLELSHHSPCLRLPTSFACTKLSNSPEEAGATALVQFELLVWVIIEAADRVPVYSQAAILPGCRRGE